MAIKSSGKKNTIFNEINITPLTDIFLVLLIIMMVIAPMFQALDQDISLPSINSGLHVDENEVTVAITKKSKFYVNSAPVEESELAERLKSLIEGPAVEENEAETDIKAKKKEKKVVVKADAKTKTKEIMKVMRAAQEAGYEKLTVAGEPLSAQKQEELEENSETAAEEISANIQ